MMMYAAERKSYRKAIREIDTFSASAEEKVRKFENMRVAQMHGDVPDVDNESEDDDERVRNTDINWCLARCLNCEHRC